MEDKSQMLETLFSRAEQYGKTSFELVKLKTIDKSADIIGNLVAHVVVIICVSLFVFILSLGVSFWIGESFGHLYYGFMAVSGFYALAGCLFYLFRKSWIKDPIGNSVIKQALND